MENNATNNRATIRPTFTIRNANCRRVAICKTKDQVYLAMGDTSGNSYTAIEWWTTERTSTPQGSWTLVGGRWC